MASILDEASKFNDKVDLFEDIKNEAKKTVY